MPASDYSEALSKAQQFAQLSENPAWRECVLFLESLVQEAEDDLTGNVSSDEKARSNLVWRWQQRKAVKDALIQLVDSWVRERDKILEEMKNEYDERTGAVSASRHYD